MAVRREVGTFIAYSAPWIVFAAAADFAKGKGARAPWWAYALGAAAYLSSIAYVSSLDAPATLPAKKATPTPGAVPFVGMLNPAGPIAFASSWLVTMHTQAGNVIGRVRAYVSPSTFEATIVKSDDPAYTPGELVSADERAAWSVSAPAA